MALSDACIWTDDRLSPLDTEFRRQLGDWATGCTGDGPHRGIDYGLYDMPKWLQPVWTVAALANRGHVAPGDLIVVQADAGCDSEPVVFLGPGESPGAVLVMGSDGIRTVWGHTAAGVLGRPDGD